jgi:16S rRNA G1207 methylase RsmC
VAPYFKEKRRGVGEKKSCPEEKSFVRKKNSWGQKIILLPEKLTHVPGKKSQVSGEKSPGMENLLFHRQKNGPHSKKMDLARTPKKWICSKKSSPGADEKKGCTGKKSFVRKKNSFSREKVDFTTR